MNPVLARPGPVDALLAGWARLRPVVPGALVLLPSAALTALMPFALLVAALSVPASGIGLVLVPLVLVGLRLWTDAHRVLAAAVLGRPAERRFRPLRGGLPTWWKDIGEDPFTWRDLVWLPVQALVGGVLGLLCATLLAVPTVGFLGSVLWWSVPAAEPFQLVPGLVAATWPTALAVGALLLVGGSAAAVVLVPPLVTVWAMVTRAVLNPSRTELLEHRVDVLTESRAGALQAHRAELQRIERDLHDGTQSRLVSIALRLGLAQQALRDEPELAGTLLREARDTTDTAMAELRTIVRTIYPPILADRGLDGALRSLLADCPLTTQADLAPVPHLPSPVAAAAYFTVSEALANVVRHSGAGRVEVAVRHTGTRLRVEIRDDGCGGVDESGGSGVRGIRRRVAALDGGMSVQSPPGGPSTIVVELPCES
jgi:signal transduction histidine kinase